MKKSGVVIELIGLYASVQSSSGAITTYDRRHFSNGEFIKKGDIVEIERTPPGSSYPQVFKITGRA
ncbi:MAG: hypothetical protein M3N19_12025 [Candidatus Eremiobacteraeota bacterium]|nr:hypothetical protein [Candidatus Eremiobacteraeota bacterium]